MKYRKKGTRIVSGALALALMSSICGISASAQAPKFSDVPESHWAYANITRLCDKGIVGGMGDGRFSPDGTVTGAQFIKMIVDAMVMGAGDETTVATMMNAKNDHPTTWFEPYAKAAQAANLCDGTAYAGYAANSDEWNWPIQRYEMASILYNCVEKDSTVKPSKVTSVTIADFESLLIQEKPVRDAVKYVYAAGLMSGYDDGQFLGYKMMNRAEATAIICRLMDWNAEEHDGVLDTSTEKITLENMDSYLADYEYFDVEKTPVTKTDGDYADVRSYEIHEPFYSQNSILTDNEGTYDTLSPSCPIIKGSFETILGMTEEELEFDTIVFDVSLSTSDKSVTSIPYKIIYSDGTVIREGTIDRNSDGTWETERVKINTTAKLLHAMADDDSLGSFRFVSCYNEFDEIKIYDRTLYMRQSYKGWRRPYQFSV